MRLCSQEEIYLQRNTNLWYLCGVMDLNTNSMEQSPSSETNSHSASQEFSCILWNQKFITVLTRACQFQGPV
jgi:hypothetical protein